MLLKSSYVSPLRICKILFYPLYTILQWRLVSAIYIIIDYTCEIFFDRKEIKKKLFSFFSFENNYMTRTKKQIIH